MSTLQIKGAGQRGPAHRSRLRSELGLQAKAAEPWPKHERIDRTMSIQAHIDSLAEKREQIKALIAAETAHPMPNLVLITNLKKQNLALKEEMQRYFIMLDTKQYNTSS